MKLLAIVASTLFFVLISQQFTSALPVNETLLDFTTEDPRVEHSKDGFFGLRTESPLVETKRATFASLEEPESGHFQQQTHQHVQQHTQQIQQTTEERGFVDFTTEFPSTESEHHTIESSGFNKVQQHTEHPHSVENVNEKTKRGTNEGTDDEDDEEAKKREETEEHTEEKKPVKEEKPKKVEAKHEEEKTEEHVEEEKPKKVKEEKSESSEFCPENYVKFEDSCLFVGPKGKVSARSGKVPISKTDSSLVENFPVNEDNSCPPGTVHTERGVCQKTLTEAEAKAKKIAHSCPENAEFVNGKCVFHSFDLTNSTMQAPLETSERPEVSPVEPIGTATESKSIIESEFATTMQSVLKS